MSAYDIGYLMVTATACVVVLVLVYVLTVAE